MQNLKTITFAFAFFFAFVFSVTAQNHWTPDVREYDNYMTLSAYIMLNGNELKSNQIEVAGFINGVCRGNYRLAPAEHDGHPYPVYLQVWGSPEDNGKLISIKIYDHATATEYIAEQTPVYQYNGMLGFPTLYELTVTTNDQLDNADISAAKTLVENAVYSDIQVNIPNLAAARTKVETIISGLNLNGVSTNVINGTFTAAIEGTVSNINGTNGSFTFTVTLNKGAGTQQTTGQLTLTIIATPYNTTQDEADIAAAKTLLENADFTFSQENGNTQEELLTSLLEYINTLLEGTGITVTANDITISSFTPATAGTENNPDGTAGSFTFTVTLKKGASSSTTGNITASITASVYTSVNNVKVLPLKAIKTNSGLLVSGLTPMEIFHIYNSAGQLLHTEKATNSQQCVILLPINNNILIIRQGDKKVKVIY